MKEITFKSMHKAVLMVFIKVKSSQCTNKGTEYCLRTEHIDKGFQDQYIIDGHNTQCMLDLNQKNPRKDPLNSDIVQDKEKNP